MADLITINRVTVEQALSLCESVQGLSTDDEDGSTVWCQELIEALRAAIALAEPVQAATPKVRPSGNYRVEYRCKDCGHSQYVTEVVRAEGTYVGSGANWCDACGGLPVRAEAAHGIKEKS